jgi:hypothetical protein
MTHIEPERPGPRSQLGTERLEELGAVARGYLSEEITDEHLERVVTAVSRHARERGMKAEELIVLCKEMWHSLPADGLHAERSTRTKKLERLVAICIEGYFADR